MRQVFRITIFRSKSFVVQSSAHANTDKVSAGAPLSHGLGIFKRCMRVFYLPNALVPPPPGEFSGLRFGCVFTRTFDSSMDSFKGRSSTKIMWILSGELQLLRR